MATTQTQSHLPTPITKPGLSYGKNVIATINNRWVHIQSKDFDGDTSIPTEKGLNKNWETIPWLLLKHRAKYQHQLQNQAYPMVKM